MAREELSRGAMAVVESRIECSIEVRLDADVAILGFRGEGALATR